MKKALIIAAVLLALGIMIGLGGLAMTGFDFSKLSSVTYMTQTYTPDGYFADITIPRFAGVILKEKRNKKYKTTKTSN